MSKPRVIAFYLPQFYPTPENDEWWGKGFTEWTNVRKAQPLFNGHDQPKIPGELGYYDLRDIKIREQQAELARRGGIEGFCYWHYWFNGRRLLDRVFSEVIESGKPDFPFCLCWANHSWYKKTWDKSKGDKLLIEQTYGGEEDYKRHFEAMLPAFKDPRYITVDGRLLFGLFAPTDFHEFRLFASVWNNLAHKNGLAGFHFFGYTTCPWYYNKIMTAGYDSVVMDYVRTVTNTRSLFYRLVKHIQTRMGLPHPVKYIDYVKKSIPLFDANLNLFPSIDPNFDHSPRSGSKGTILFNSTPELWGELCDGIFDKTASRQRQDNIVFIKAWNEWGEGNYLEPDARHGMAYIDVLKQAIDRQDD